MHIFLYKIPAKDRTPEENLILLIQLANEIGFYINSITLSSEVSSKVRTPMSDIRGHHGPISITLTEPE